MGGGILPVAHHNGAYYFLFSRESSVPKHNSSGLWCDFGGRREGNESHMDTALREGFEESNGLLGSVKKLRFLIKNHLFQRVTVRGYSLYITQISYNEKLADQFKDIYDNAMKNTPNLVREHNGLYEKDMAKWVHEDDLMDMMPNVKFWFKPILEKMIVHVKQHKYRAKYTTRHPNFNSNFKNKNNNSRKKIKTDQYYVPSHKKKS